MSGFVDSIAGGGGLISLPALLLAGVPPTEALATNKLQSSFGSGAAAGTFILKGFVSPSRMLPAIICTFTGAAAGTLCVQIMDTRLLIQLIPLLLIGFAMYFALSSRLSDADSHAHLPVPVFSIIFGLLIGFYDGFFGPGTGSFFALAFILLLGYNTRSATAHSKVLNFTSNLASLLFFTLGGHVLWGIGLMMGSAQLVGASLGARLVIEKGTSLVRIMLVTTSVVISAVMIVRNPDHFLIHLFSLG